MISVDPLQEIFFTYRIIYETQSQKNDLVSDTPKTFWLGACAFAGIATKLVTSSEREETKMNFFDYLPYLIWWLLIIALSGFGIFTIGLALISLVIEREEAKK